MVKEGNGIETRIGENPPHYLALIPQDISRSDMVRFNTTK